MERRRSNTSIRVADTAFKGKRVENEFLKSLGPKDGVGDEPTRNPRGSGKAAETKASIAPGSTLLSAQETRGFRHEGLEGARSSLDDVAWDDFDGCQIWPLLAIE